MTRSRPWRRGTERCRRGGDGARGGHGSQDDERRSSAGAGGRADGEAAPDRHRDVHPRAAPHHGEQARVRPARGVGVRPTGPAAPREGHLLPQPDARPAVAARDPSADRDAAAGGGAALPGQLGPVVEHLPDRGHDPRPLLGAGAGGVPRELPALRAALREALGQTGGAGDRGLGIDGPRPAGAVPRARREDPGGAERRRSGHPPAGSAGAHRAERRRARAAQADRRARRGSRDLLRQRPGRPAAVPADRGRADPAGTRSRSRRRRGRAARSAGSSGPRS